MKQKKRVNLPFVTNHKGPGRGGQALHEEIVHEGAESPTIVMVRGYPIVAAGAGEGAVSSVGL